MGDPGFVIAVIEVEALRDMLIRGSSAVENARSIATSVVDIGTL